MINAFIIATSLMPGTMQMCVPCDDTPFPQPVPHEQHIEKNDLIKMDRQTFHALLDLAERYIYEFERGAIPHDICIRRLEEIIKYLERFAIYEEN